MTGERERRREAGGCGRARGARRAGGGGGEGATRVCVFRRACPAFLFYFISSAKNFGFPMPPKQGNRAQGEKAQSARRANKKTSDET